MVRNTLVCVVFFLVTVASAQSARKTMHNLFASAPFAISEIQLPAIPEFSISIAAVGAVSDGLTLNTNHFRQAIEKCVQHGGGKVIVPPGMWLTGPIEMKSNIELHIEEGAVILFSSDLKDYPMYQRYHGSSYKRSPLIYGLNVHDAAITGTGMLDGNGQYWRPTKKEKLTEKQWKILIRSGGIVSSDGKIWYPSEMAMNGGEYLKSLKKEKKKLTEEDYAATLQFLRPTMIEFVRSTNLLFDGVTITNAPAWTLSPVQCDNVIINGITIRNPWWGQNTDGIDINSCHSVLVYNSTVDVGDDAICLKPSAASPRHESEPSCKDIVIANCKIYHGHGGFVIGSESYGRAENIFVTNLTMFETDIGLRFKSAVDRGGEIKNVTVDGIRMNDIADEAVLFDFSYDGDKPAGEGKGERIPNFHNFSIKNIECNGASAAIVANGMPDIPVRDMIFDNIVIKSERGCTLSDVENFHFSNVQCAVNTGPIFDINNGNGIELNKVAYSDSVELFMKVSGSKSSGIVLSNTDPSKAVRDFDISPDVGHDPIIKK